MELDLFFCESVSLNTNIGQGIGLIIKVYLWYTINIGQNIC